MFDAEISTVIKARRPTPARSDRCNGYPRNRTAPACVRRGREADRSRRSASAPCVARASLRGREFGRWSKSREDWRRGTRSSSACTNRDLPMPGSPEIGTTWHSPVWTRRQRRAAWRQVRDAVRTMPCILLGRIALNVGLRATFRNPGLMR